MGVYELPLHSRRGGRHAFPETRSFPSLKRYDESSDASIVRARSVCSSHKSYEPERHIGWYICILMKKVGYDKYKNAADKYEKYGK